MISWFRARRRHASRKVFQQMFSHLDSVSVIEHWTLDIPGKYF